MEDNLPIVLEKSGQDRIGYINRDTSPRLVRPPVHIGSAKQKIKSKILLDNKDEIIRYYRDKNWTAARVAKKFNLGESTINLKLKEWGIPAHNYTKAIPMTVKKLYDQGLTPHEIAKTLDVDSGTIYKVLVSHFGIHHTKKVSFSVQEDFVIRSLNSRGLSIPLIISELNRQFPNRPRTYPVVYARIQELGLSHTAAIRKSSDRANKHYSPAEIAHFVESIRPMRSKGISIDSMAKTLNVSKSLIARLIQEYKIPRVNKVFNDEVKSKIAELYRQGLHYDDIANRLGLKSESVRQEVSRIGFNKFLSPFSKSFTPEQIQKQEEYIRKYYQAPYFYSMGYLAKVINLDKTTIRARLEKMGIPVRNREAISHIGSINLQHDDIIRKYYQAPWFYTMAHISSMIHVSHSTVRNRLEKMHIPIRESPGTPVNAPPMDAAIDNAIKKYYQEPYLFTIARLARLLHVNSSFIRTRLQRMGIPITIRSYDNGMDVYPEFDSKFDTSLTGKSALAKFHRDNKIISLLNSLGLPTTIGDGFSHFDEMYPGKLSYKSYQRIIYDLMNSGNITGTTTIGGANGSYTTIISARERTNVD